MKHLKKILPLTLSMAMIFTACTRLRVEDTPSEQTTLETETTKETITTLNQTPGLDLSDYALTVEGGTLFISEKSEENSKATALQLLQLCGVTTAKDTADAFAAFGLETIVQKNYDKEQKSADHTCAYTLGQGKAVRGKVPANIKLIDIRGTSGGEWYSNFDVSPSGKADMDVSENFLYAAEDVLAGIKDNISKEDTIIVCGFSRGAACANLLGLLLTELYGADNIYVYTYATPATINKSSSLAAKKYTNIFNYINEADLVPALPLEKWGFVRAGTDIILSNETESVKNKVDTVSILEAIAPDIDRYYNFRHSLTEAGEDQWGMTGYEVMQILAGQLINAMNNTSSDKADNYGQISEKSDLYPLIQTLSSWSEDKEKLIGIAKQHLPLMYASLIMNT